MRLSKSLTRELFKRNLRPAFVLFLLFCLSNTLFGQETLTHTATKLTADTSVQTLKVLSWNIYMLPPLAKFTGKQRRARKIGELLKNSDFDIFVFQEAFHGAARRKIWRRLKDNFPYKLGPANRRWYSLKNKQRNLDR